MLIRFPPVIKYTPSFYCMECNTQQITKPFLLIRTLHHNNKINDEIKNIPTKIKNQYNLIESYNYIPKKQTQQTNTYLFKDDEDE